MAMSLHWKQGLISLIVTFLLSGCMAPVHDGEASLASNGGACEVILQDAFSKGFYPWLQTTCGACHRAGGAGNGAFADPDIKVAFEQFHVRGALLVTDRGLNPQHQGGITGPQHQPTVDPLLAEWSQREAEYNACISSAGGGSGQLPGSDKPAIFLVDRVMAAGEEPRTLTWDLSSDIREPAGASFNGAQFAVDVKIFTSVSEETSYHFTNPRLITGNKALRIQKIHVYFNEKESLQASTYKGVDRRVPANSERQLNSALMILDQRAAQGDRISFAFGGLDEINFDPPTRTELMAAGGVFGANCLGCHGDAAQGGLNLNNYDDLIARRLIVPFNFSASRIHVRMSNEENPMPAAGLLPAAQLNQVRDWIIDGAPDN